MQILVNTDKNIEGSEAFAAHVRTVVENALSHFTDHVSRVEVHMEDLNGAKSGPQDHSCTMEARPKGMDPVAATFKASNNHQAVDGAAQSLANLLRHRLDKMKDKKGSAKLPFEGA